MYRYFVAFACGCGDGKPAQSCRQEVVRSGLIRSMKDVRDIESDIEQELGGGWWACVLSWQRFECGPDELGGSHGPT